MELTLKAKALLAGHRLEPIDDIGDLMTIEHFENACTSGSFVNSDGSGVYAFEDEQTRVDARPSSFKQGDINRLFTHVMWYNK